MKSELLMKFGDRVRTLRKKHGFSQEYLAQIVDLHRTYIGQIERGEKNLSLINIDKIATAFSLSIAQLFDFSPKVDDGN